MPPVKPEPWTGIRNALQYGRICPYLDSAHFDMNGKNLANSDEDQFVLHRGAALVPGEGLIATPGTIDSHVHLSSPALLDVALATGITTMVGMGLGGVWDVGVNPEHNFDTMMSAWRDVPLNIGFLARGSASHPALLERAIEAGAAGFKVHEDFGAYPAIIDTCLSVAQEADVPVALHTDTLNEAGMLADTLDAIGGRIVHAYHIEGSGGGHPRLLELVSEPHVIGSSTTPTVAFGQNTLSELVPMAMTVHRQSTAVLSDLAVTRRRVRRATIEAENLLHDLGAIPIINSDSMGMGRIGELVRRTWQLASRRLADAGAVPPDTGSARAAGAGAGAGTGARAGRSAHAGGSVPLGHRRLRRPPRPGASAGHQRGARFGRRPARGDPSAAGHLGVPGDPDGLPTGRPD